MKKLFAIFLAIAVIPSFHAHAWTGGPFDNNSHSPNGDDGIYEAVAIVANGTGLYRWGVGNRAQATPFADARTGNTSNVQFGAFAGAYSEHVWFYRGSVYFGTCFGTVNSAIDEVRCVGNAATASPTVASTGNLGDPGLTVISPTTQLVTNTVTVVLPGGGVQTTTTTVQIPIVGTFANSFFTAEMGIDQYGRRNRQPWSREFSGTGELTLGGSSVVTGAAPSVQAGPTVTFFVFGSRVSLARVG